MLCVGAKAAAAAMLRQQQQQQQRRQQASSQQGSDSPQEQRSPPLPAATPEVKPPQLKTPQSRAGRECGTASSGARMASPARLKHLDMLQRLKQLQVEGQHLLVT